MGSGLLSTEDIATIVVLGYDRLDAWQSAVGTMRRGTHPLRLSWRYVRAKFFRLTGEWRPLLEPRIAPEQMDTEMKAASIPSLSFFFLLALSGAIATFGLLANSAPAIIGAMIIAPLMMPIMGLSYGVVQFSWSQIARSAITIFLGVAVVVAIGYLSARFIGIEVAGTEMLGRAFPTLLDPYHYPQLSPMLR
ncbi:MAG: DUF389 domain-containing protein [Pseudomonadota bacterium]|nr:DUF389 domain-containing protein [Pseudomonadota bacterium]